PSAADQLRFLPDSWRSGERDTDVGRLQRRSIVHAQSPAESFGRALERGNIAACHVRQAFTDYVVQNLVIPCHQPISTCAAFVRLFSGRQRTSRLTVSYPVEICSPASRAAIQRRSRNSANQFWTTWIKRPEPGPVTSSGRRK